MVRFSAKERKREEKVPSVSTGPAPEEQKKKNTPRLAKEE